MLDLRDKLYRIWNHINFRCYNQKCEHYHRYGGRGIENDFKTFEDFYNYTYKSFVEHVKQFGLNETTIDRIDNNKNYTYGNIKWSTRKEQAQHRCTSTYYKIHNTINNRSYIVGNVSDFCNRFGFSSTAFKTALNSGKTCGDFFIKTFDETMLTIEELNTELEITQLCKIPVTMYNVKNSSTNILTFNLKETCRELGIDPSAAYKCIKGIRKSCGGYSIGTTIVEV